MKANNSKGPKAYYRDVLSSLVGRGYKRAYPLYYFPPQCMAQMEKIRTVPLDMTESCR